MTSAAKPRHHKRKALKRGTETLLAKAHEHWPKVVPSDAMPWVFMILTLLVGGGLVTLLVAGAAEVYEGVRESSDAAALDQPILDYMLTLRTDQNAELITWYTNLGGTIGMTIIALTAVILLSISTRSWRALVLIASTAAGSLLMTIAGKELIGRDRPSLADAVPPYEHSASFPSGHTLNAAAIMTVVAYLVFIEFKRRWQRILAIAIPLFFMVTIGLSRIFLGHHWFTDVAAAFCLGLAWAGVVILAHRIWWMFRDYRHNRKNNEPRSLHKPRGS